MGRDRDGLVSYIGGSATPRAVKKPRNHRTKKFCKNNHTEGLTLRAVVARVGTGKAD